MAGRVHTSDDGTQSAMDTCLTRIRRVRSRLASPRRRASEDSTQRTHPPSQSTPPRTPRTPTSLKLTRGHEDHKRKSRGRRNTTQMNGGSRHNDRGDGAFFFLVLIFHVCLRACLPLHAHDPLRVIFELRRPAADRSVREEAARSHAPRRRAEEHIGNTKNRERKRRKKHS